ncbi:MAG TPA: hypothetical protein VLC98_16775 [Phnomibacter sp.]|nr:hypothetical protein [Phnomibacter sp.]
MTNRFSKRIYPKRACEQCKQLFHPNDARQIFCSPQHRIDYNNDKRKRKNQPFNELILTLKKNDAILEKCYRAIESNKLTSISKENLLLAEFDFSKFRYIDQNPETKEQIYWMGTYGIAAKNDTTTSYIIYKSLA